MRLHWICWAVFAENQGRVENVKTVHFYIFFYKMFPHCFKIFFFFCLRNWLKVEKKEKKKNRRDWQVTWKLKKNIIWLPQIQKLNFRVFHLSHRTDKFIFFLALLTILSHVLSIRDQHYQLCILSYVVSQVTPLCLDHSPCAQFCHQLFIGPPLL